MQVAKVGGLPTPSYILVIKTLSSLCPATSPGHGSRPHSPQDPLAAARLCCGRAPGAEEPDEAEQNPPLPHSPKPGVSPAGGSAVPEPGQGRQGAAPQPSSPPSAVPPPPAAASPAPQPHAPRCKQCPVTPQPRPDPPIPTRRRGRSAAGHQPHSSQEPHSQTASQQRQHTQTAHGHCSPQPSSPATPAAPVTCARGSVPGGCRWRGAGSLPPAPGPRPPAPGTEVLPCPPGPRSSAAAPTACPTHAGVSMQLLAGTPQGPWAPRAAAPAPAQPSPANASVPFTQPSSSRDARDGLSKKRQERGGRIKINDHHR